jgi:hypothetical protein
MLTDIMRRNTRRDGRESCVFIFSKARSGRSRAAGTAVEDCRVLAAQGGVIIKGTNPHETSARDESEVKKVKMVKRKLFIVFYSNEEEHNSTIGEEEKEHDETKSENHFTQIKFYTFLCSQTTTFLYLLFW